MKKILKFIIFILLFFSIDIILRMQQQNYPEAFALVFLINYLLLLLPITLSFIPVRKSSIKVENNEILIKKSNENSETFTLDEHTVSIVIPNYNEDNELIEASLHSIVNQTYPIKEILFIDDGSTDRAGIEALEAKFQGQVTFLYQGENKGKKAAQLRGIELVDSTYFVCIDSDTILDENAIMQLTKSFLVSPNIGAVVGKINVKNSEKFLGTMQNILYNNSFNISRHMQSLFGAIVVCSGALSMYRSAVIKENIDVFIKKRRIITGDDRCLTSIVLKNGYKTKYQKDAICYTDVPDTLSKFTRQQIRWTESSYYFSFECFPFLWKNFMAYIFMMISTYSWILILIIKFVVIYSFFVLFTWQQVLVVLGINLLLIYMSDVDFVRVSLPKYLLTPIYLIPYSILFVFIKIYSIFSLLFVKNTWGTR